VRARRATVVRECVDRRGYAIDLGYQSQFLAGLVAPPASRVGAASLRTFNELVEIAKLPVEQQAEPINQLRPSPRRPSYVDYLETGCVEEFLSFRQDRTQMRCLIALLAVERYRLARGRWPASLPDVAPEFLKGVPVDPYDGRPLRYRALEDGVVVYSV